MSIWKKTWDITLIQIKITLLDRTHLCGYDINLTYPQNGKFAPVIDPFQFSGPRAQELASRKPRLLHRNLIAIARGETRAETGIVKRNTLPTRHEIEDRENRRKAWLHEKKSIMEKRDLSGRANGSIDPWYGCFLSSELSDYALNFSMPWSKHNFVLVSRTDINLILRSDSGDRNTQPRWLWSFQCTRLLSPDNHAVNLV